jgi:spore coat protein U-like protein
LKSRGTTSVAAACALLALVLVPAQARAESTCNVSVTPLAFGTYDPTLATPDDSAGTVTVTCTNRPPPGNVNISYLVQLSRGVSGSFAPRQMASGADRLAYNLYLDAARSLVWGDGSAGTSVAAMAYKLAGNKSESHAHTIYGRMPAQQPAAVGNYTDTIVVTLEF